MNLGNLERTLLKKFFEEADVLIFEEDFDEEKYQEIVSFLEGLIGINIDETAYW